MTDYMACYTMVMTWLATTTSNRLICYKIYTNKISQIYGSEHQYNITHNIAAKATE